MSNPARTPFAAWIAAFGCAFVFACDDECKVGTTECISDALIRTCVPGAGSNTWLVSQCGPTETCKKPTGAGSKTVDAGSSKGDAGATSTAEVAACVGTCTVGEHECVSDALARYCVNGGVWQLDSCTVGEVCAKGECGLGSGDAAVRLCVPGTKACATDKVQKVCDPDGTAWVESQCAANELCTMGACAPDPKSSCDDANVCMDNKTAIRCLGRDAGFKLVKCEGDLYCEGGRCRGKVCAVGSSCSGSNQVRECVDGKLYKDTQCGINEVCQQNKDVASCVPLQCTPGTSACGDPRDPSVDPKKGFSTCVTGIGSGIPEWVRGECSGASSCNPVLANTSNPCSQSCTKGAQRCASDPQKGVNDGIQTCGDEGTWGETSTCNPGRDGRMQCVLTPNPNASELPKAMCAAPVCAWSITNASVAATGACEGDKLRKCKPDGTLADLGACEVGICRTRRTVTTADGRMPGACDLTPECKDGEEICANSGGAATPRYRSCLNGYFQSELKTCADDGACYTAKDENGLRHKLCGAQCSPGSRRCNANGELEPCDAQGKWGPAQKCAAGTCRAVGNNDASCVLDCVPNTKLCTGTAAVAPDGFHAGTMQEISCGADGLRGAPKACEAGKVCRVSDSGVALGCVACVGPTAPGGNDEGTMDTRCDPNDAKKVQECSDKNEWQTSRMCAGTKSCVSPAAGTCGNCVGAHNTSFTCTQSHIVNEPVCAGCTIELAGGGTTTLASCTQSDIATANSSSSTCSSQDQGTPGNWGGEPDCCSDAQTTSGAQVGASCVSLGHGAPSAWGGVPDCCASYQTSPGGAANFAYCE